MATALTIGERPLDHDALVELTAALRPTATAYVPARSDRVDADHRVDLHWRELARTLEADGADPADVDALAEAVGGDHTGGDTIVAVAAGGDLRASGFISEPIDRALAAVGPVPALLPLLAWTQTRMPHLVVVADRVGADLIVVSPTERDRALTVDGDEHHIHRSAPGGWSQRRFQQRAENRWEANAAAVAESVERLVDDIGARAVVVAGDERAVGFLREHLPRHVDELVRPIAGSRAEWSEDRIADETVRQIATESAESLLAELEHLGDATAAGTAVEGREAVCEALRRARIDRLYVVDDTADDERAGGWTADDPAYLFAGATRPDVGVDLQSVALHDAAVRTAVLTGAEVMVVPAHGRHAPSEGIGGLLRGSH